MKKPARPVDWIIVMDMHIPTRMRSPVHEYPCDTGQNGLVASGEPPLGLNPQGEI